MLVAEGATVLSDLSNLPWAEIIGPSEDVRRECRLRRTLEPKLTRLREALAWTVHSRTGGTFSLSDVEKKQQPEDSEVINAAQRDFMQVSPERLAIESDLKAAAPDIAPALNRAYTPEVMRQIINQNLTIVRRTKAAELTKIEIDTSRLAEILNLTDKNLHILPALFESPDFKSEFLRRCQVTLEFVYGNAFQEAYWPTESPEPISEDSFEEQTKEASRLASLQTQSEQEAQKAISDLRSLFETMHQNAKKSQLSHAQYFEILTILSPIINMNTCLGQSFFRRNQYPGPSQFMEHIYNYWEQDEAERQKLPWYDRLVLECSSARDVHERRSIIASKIATHLMELQAENPSTRKMKVVGLASGSAAMEKELVELLGPDFPVNIQGFDGESEAVNFANLRCQGLAEFQQKNLVRLPTADIAGANVINSIGLWDYFPNKQFTAKLAEMYKALAPGGLLIIGQFHDEGLDGHHEDTAYLDTLNWNLRRRNQPEMKTLAQDAGIPFESVTIEKVSEDGPQLLFMARKTLKN